MKVEEQAEEEIDEEKAAYYRNKRNEFVGASLKYANEYIVVSKSDEDGDEEIDEDVVTDLITKCEELYVNFELDNKDIDHELEPIEEEKAEEEKDEDQKKEDAKQ